MSAAEVLRAAHTAGIAVTLDGAGLLLEGIAEPPEAVLDALARHKPAILALLRRRECEWTSDHWRAYFDRLIWIATFRDDLPPAKAEAWALEFCVNEWLKR